MQLHGTATNKQTINVAANKRSTKKKPLKKVEWQIVGDNLDEDLESKPEIIKQPQSTVVYPHLGQPLKPEQRDGMRESLRKIYEEEEGTELFEPLFLLLLLLLTSMF